MHLDTDACLAQGLQGHQHHRQRAALRYHRIGVEWHYHLGAALFPDQCQHPVNPERPAYRWRRFAAQLLDQVIVAAASANRALRTKPVGNELKHCQVVVVHAPHQARIDGVSHAIGIQNSLQSVEVGQRCRTEKVEQARRGIHHALHRRVLGIQDPERIAVQATPRVVVQHISMALQMRDQGLPVLQAFLGLAQAVDFKPDIGEAKFVPEG